MPDDVRILPMDDGDVNIFIHFRNFCLSKYLEESQQNTQPCHHSYPKKEADLWVFLEIFRGFSLLRKSRALQYAGISKKR